MLIGIKDNICMRGHEATAASRILEGHRAVYDATVVSRLRDAGAILAGRCNMDEFAMGSSGETSVYGPVLHPFLDGYVPGGSSSGSASAVAAGLLHAALGSDTGGSVRQPAAYTGTVGLKPTWGRVSRSGLIAFASSFDQIGPITSNVRDNARVLAVIAGIDARDATTADIEVPDFLASTSRGVAGMRIGIPIEFLGGALPQEVRAGVRRIAAALEKKGAVLAEISLPLTPVVFPAYFIMANAEATSNLARYDGVRLGRPGTETQQADGNDPASLLAERYGASRREGFGREVRRRILLGMELLIEGEEADWYERARRVRRRVRDEYDAAFTNVDLLLTPVTAGPPFRFGERLEHPLRMYLTDMFNTSANLTGLPAISVPAGNDDAGLPFAVQFIAGAFREDQLYAAAGAVENIMTSSRNPDRGAG
jgi:aspartyl-tRNA(Asn)/glutamyl-tRNA(Gln) amidotransferase subunit A